VWKGGKFAGLRFLGDTGYFTIWFKTQNECQKTQAEAMTSMAASTASIQTLIERDVESRLLLDKKVSDLIERCEDDEHEPIEA
ncbi:MAG: hypothetical protein KDA84_09490, partial [Planctomycetaceae bacterium]|nr:hypothetical protein [Planctomycetaceae bacterium]